MQTIFLKEKDSTNDIEDYNSHNTDRLDVEGMKKLLLKLDFIKEDISE